MDLFERINEDIKQAMKSKEAERLMPLRALKSELLLAKSAEGASVITREMEIKILQKMIKQRRDSADIFSKENRPELVEKELAEAAVIQTYMPSQLDENQILETVKAIIAEVGATSQKDFGKVMGMATKRFAGQADNKVVSEKIRSLLPA